MAKHSNKMMMV